MGNAGADVMGYVTKNWWALLLRGLLAIGVGIYAFVQPGITLGALVLLFGIWALADGVFCLATLLAGQPKGARPWWSVLLEGIISIGAGILTFAYPGITLLALVFIVAARAIIVGAMEIVAAIRLRKEMTGEWMMGLLGVVQVLFGILVIAYPAAGTVAIVYFLGVFLMISGVIWTVMAFKMRSVNKRIERGEPVGTATTPSGYGQRPVPH